MESSNFYSNSRYSYYYCVVIIFFYCITIISDKKILRGPNHRLGLAPFKTMSRPWHDQNLGALGAEADEPGNQDQAAMLNLPQNTS
jgi:hypothetical protein